MVGRTLEANNLRAVWWALLLGVAHASSPLCSMTTAGGQACKIYKVKDCENLVDVPLVRNVQCPAAFNAVQEILRIVSLKTHATHYDGYMEFYIDDITLARSNNTCKQKFHLKSNNDTTSFAPDDAVCHALTTLTSPGAKATWTQGVLRPLPTLIGKLLAARPKPILTFSHFSPTWNSLVNQMGISTEVRFAVESMIDAMKKVFASLLARVMHENPSQHHVSLSAGGGGGWGGGIMLSNGQKAIDFGGGGGGGVVLDGQGQKNIRVDGGAGTLILEHTSSKKSQYFPTLGLSGMSNGMDILPMYTYKEQNHTTSCYDKDILGEYLISIQDVYHQLKETYASGGMFVLQGGGGQGAGLQFNLPEGNVQAFTTGSGFMFDYLYYDADLVRKVTLLADPLDNLYKNLGRIYQEASDYAATVCKNSSIPMCECQARYEYVLMESKNYADPLPSWITTNTCQAGSDTDRNSCKSWIKMVS